jgi:hypothetical protein
VALVAYSFGGFLLKSLVVEARKHLLRRRRNVLDDEVHKCCEIFLNNVEGVIFYGVPHGVAQSLSKYLTWQDQQINTLNKCLTQSNFFRSFEYYISHMEHLWHDFENATDEDLTIYAFGEGLPMDNEFVRFSYHHIESYPARFIS